MLFFEKYVFVKSRAKARFLRLLLSPFGKVDAWYAFVRVLEEEEEHKRKRRGLPDCRARRFLEGDGRNFWKLNPPYVARHKKTSTNTTHRTASISYVKIKQGGMHPRYSLGKAFLFPLEQRSRLE